MSDWRVTGAHFDAKSRWCFAVTKGGKRVGLEDQDELEALLNPWRPIASAPRDGTTITLRRGNKVATGSWLEWGDTRPDHDELGKCVGERYQAPGAIWSCPTGGFAAGEPPTHWMPLN
jgi:hypothetical protein